MAFKSECRRLLVAALDFGTTYSGYAFSFKNDPMTVTANQAWVAGSTQLISLKTPTCILLKQNQEFHSFGYEAENKYADLATDGEHENWYFFKQFKMLLHNSEGLNQNTMIEDTSGRKMPAMTIISLSIKYLKDHLMGTLRDRVSGIVQEDVHFAITLPAIWDDKAKQYMRDAAVKYGHLDGHFENLVRLNNSKDGFNTCQAGISNDQLVIALEPEAAAIWCERLESLKGSTVEKLFRPGLKYMVVDLGGGTIDVAVHEMKHDGSLREIYKPSGGPWGGTCVDKNFLAFIGKIVGQDILREFMKRETSDYIDLLREFETKKRTIKNNMDTKITCKMPFSLMKIFEEKGGEISSAITRSGFVDKVSWVGDKFRFDPSIGVSFFDESIKSTINHVKKLLSDTALNKLQKIILVGGFSECELVQDAFKSNFGKEMITIPDGGGLVVLKGAVISVHVPRTITTRIARFTYGIKTVRKFDPAIHPAEKKVVYDGKSKCTDVFDKYVEIGEELEVDRTITKSWTPVRADQTEIDCKVFISTEKSPKFVTDPSCRLLGKFTVPLPAGKKIKDKEVKESMIFGDTELMFKVVHLKHGKEFKTYLQYE